MEGIYKKVLALQERVAQFRKDKQNPHFKYAYASATGVNDAIKPVLTELGIVAQLEVDQAGIVNNVVIAKATLRLIDTADGSSLSFSSLGSGTDSGDKHAMKAATAAQKYATIAAVFGATNDDPEADEKTDAPKALVARKDTSVYGKDGAEARQAQQRNLQDQAFAPAGPVAVVIGMVEEATRTGKGPFKIPTDQGIFQTFDTKVKEKVTPGAIVIYEKNKFGNQIIEVKAKDGGDPDAA